MHIREASISNSSGSRGSWRSAFRVSRSAFSFQRYNYLEPASFSRCREDMNGSIIGFNPVQDVGDTYTMAGLGCIKTYAVVFDGKEYGCCCIVQLYYRLAGLCMPDDIC